MQGDLFGGQPATVVNVKTQRCDLYCGRAMPGQGFPTGSLWANPHRIKSERDRSMALQNFRADLMADPGRLLKIPELRGLALGCWCAPKPCHCHILAELANGSAARLLTAYMAARRSFGRASSPAPDQPAQLEFLQRHSFLPASLARWGDIQDDQANAALAGLARLHAAIAKAA